MEEKQKVLIRGRKGRGSEIIKILEGLGATNKDEMGCEDENSIYFIDHKGKISCMLCGSESEAIIMDNYKELVLPEKLWKEGDILIDDSDPKRYAVFKERVKGLAFRAYFVLLDKTAYFDTLANARHFHLANGEEIESLPPLFCFLMGKLNGAGLCLLKKVDEKKRSDEEL